MATETLTTAGLIAGMADELVETRRRLHRAPELGFEERETAAFVAARLRVIEGVEDVREGVGGTGVTAVVRGARPGPVLLVRADIDALPIHEATGAPYASERAGAMHACGHDGHTAILLAAARVLAARRDHVGGTAFLVFQPAEELGLGAQAMVDDGLWDLAPGPVAATLGLHLANMLPVGAIGVREGPFFAAANRFSATFTGRGGHGAMPQFAVNPVLAAAEAVLSLQRIVGNELDPLDTAILSVCQLEAGTAPNIIPEQARLAGTLRTYSAVTRQDIANRMGRVVAGVAAACGVRHALEVAGGVPAVVNEGDMCALVRAVAAPVVGVARVIEPPRATVSDDVSVFLERAPGCYFLVGSGDAARGLDAPHHHPRFDIAEQALAIGATVLADAALAYLDPSRHA